MADNAAYYSIARRRGLGAPNRSCDLRRFQENLAVARVAGFGDDAPGGRLGDRAVRLAQVRAVVEPAAQRRLDHFAEERRQLAGRDVAQAELVDAGAIYKET